MSRFNYYKEKRFQEPEEMQKLIDEYISKFDDEDDKKCPSIAGLCLHLGVSKETLREYRYSESHAKFHDVAKSAILAIEEENVKRGFKGNTFANFMLARQHDYKETNVLQGEMSHTFFDKVKQRADAIEYIPEDKPVALIEKSE